MKKTLIDKTNISVKAGDGGDGRVSFKRAKFLPKGGPDGGDGGDGGDVYIVADPNKATLMDFRSRPDYEAKDGEIGGEDNKTGKSGDDLYIKVPVGTLIYVVDGDGEQTLIGDMTDEEVEEPLLVAKGGRGGRGNASYKSSTNQAPRQFTEGTIGEEKEILLEIKLVADIGLVGYPNAGKSTLVNNLTGAKARTANYPFTTLSPNLGPWNLKSGQTVVVSDIPGLIGGASEGKGLGDEFLRHVERTRMLIHLVDPLSYIVAGDFEADDLPGKSLESYRDIRRELENYPASLEDKPEIVVINKIDVTEVREVLENIVALFQSEGIEAFGISAATGEGFEKLEEEVIKALETAPKRAHFKPDDDPARVYNIDTLPNRRIVRRGDRN